MDVDLYAAQAAFELMAPDAEEENKDENIAMVDVGASIMTVNVLRNGQSIYLREQPFGGNELSQEIGRALQYFFTSTPHHKVHYVMLAGGTATLPGLKDRVTELTGFASMVVNPFDNMRLGSSVRESKLRREAPSYLTACGLAMRRFLQ
jgi:type IV pilus assembly protein PilM